MKRNLILLTLIVLILGCNTKRSDSIDTVTLNAEQIQSLAIACRIWRIMKYHHPEFASGTVDLDQELILILRDVLVSRTKFETEAILLKWINKYPTPVKANPKKQKENGMPIAYPDSSWIFNSGFNGKLERALVEIKHCNRVASN